jgi:hypothetical protein
MKILKSWNIFITKIYMSQSMKIRNIFQKWGCMWYFCLKLSMVNDIGTNYQIPPILISSSDLLSVYHLLDVAFSIANHKCIIYFFILFFKYQLYERGIVFFPFNFCLWTWHGTKSMSLLASQDNSKSCVVYNLHIVYTTNLNLDHWINIKVIANWSGCKLFYIYTICLHFDYWNVMEDFKMFA